MKGIGMLYKTLIGIMLPLVGTTLGGGLVFLMKGGLSLKLERILLAFAGGVMSAASVFSLILPAIELSSHLGGLSALPVSVGFALGVLFLILTDFYLSTRAAHTKTDSPLSLSGSRGRLILAVAIHNFPEGMAVGVAFASLISEGGSVSFAGACALSVGIAIQNFPEGAIISMPMRASGISRSRSFLASFLSGIVEPVGAALMILFASAFLPLLPYVLGFAAGAMIYAVVDGLLPSPDERSCSVLAPLFYSIGFLIMTLLDVIL